MEEGKDVLPPSKKRVAGREISRDNPGLDDDNDDPEPEMGTFKRASDEVLANRRIVKVRRQQQAPASSSNPFAGINFVAPTKPVEGIGKPADHHENDADKSHQDEHDYVRDKLAENGAAVDGGNANEGKNLELKSDCKPSAEDTEIEKSKSDNMATQPRGVESNDEEAWNESESKGEGLDATEKEISEKDEVKNRGGTVKEVDEESKEADKNTETDVEKQDSGNKDKAESTVHLSSFQQLSNNQNAFTGLAGTGFSGSSFSFGSVSKEGSAFGVGSGSLFGQQNAKLPFPSFGVVGSNNGSSLQLFGPDSIDTTKGGGSSVPAMQEVPVETGEENEKVVFNADAILFEYIDGGWKERGKGELRVNVSTLGTERARLVMRARGNYRLILNSSLYPDMTLKSMDKRGITFACVNSAGEGKGGLTTFALKFKESLVMEEFRETVTAYKGTKTSTTLKTPENSPKASDD